MLCLPSIHEIQCVLDLGLLAMPFINADGVCAKHQRMHGIVINYDSMDVILIFLFCFCQ